jgi:hypothetical protein
LVWMLWYSRMLFITPWVSEPTRMSESLVSTWGGEGGG